MIDENKFSNLFLAIKLLFDESSIDQKEYANIFINQWQQSDNSIQDCFDLISTVQDPHVLFIVIKTIQFHIRFLWERICDKHNELLVSLLTLLKKTYILQIHQDFILICISDIANQTGILNDMILNSIPSHLILRFFAFFFENWHESFITHLIQPNFISIGIEMMKKFEIGIDWFRIMKSLSSEINEFELFVSFFPQLIEIEVSDENREFFIEIVSNFCFLNFDSIEKFQLFIEFFTNCSRKVTSLNLWISFFEIESSFFDVDENGFLNAFELAMNEFFRTCLNEIEMNSNESNFLWIDIISILFSFFQSHNSMHVINYELNFLNLILSLLNLSRIHDDEIKSILSNLNTLLAFQPFIQNVQANLSFYLIVVYNSNFVPIEFIIQITENLFNNESLRTNDFLLLSFIEKVYFLLDKNFSDKFLLAINELFQSLPNKSSKVLYNIVSKKYMSIPGQYFEVFHRFIQFESPFVIPSLLFLLKKEEIDFFNEIQSKLQEIMSHLSIYDSLLFIFSMLKKFPKSELPFLSTFFNEFSIYLFNLLAPISLNLDDIFINNKIIEIFSILIKNKYLFEFDLFIQWIDHLLTIEGRVTEYHIDFISNFNIFSFHNLKQFLIQFLISTHESTNVSESELFKSIIELMMKKSFECPIEMWKIFSIQFVFDALAMKSDTVLENARLIVSNNIKEINSASFFINMLVSHLFSDENKLSVVLLLSSISRKMDSDMFKRLLSNSFPFNTEILNQFISLLINPVSIPRLLSISQQIVQVYS